MSKDVIIYSTSTNDSAFAVYAPATGKGEARRVSKRIVIKGGANRAHRKTLITNKGEVTMLSVEDYDLIKDNPQFKRGMASGFFVVSHTKKDDADKVAKDMTARDGSAPETRETLQKKGKGKVHSVGSADNDDAE